LVSCAGPARQREEPRAPCPPLSAEIQRLDAFYHEHHARVEFGGKEALKILGIIESTTPSDQRLQTATLVGLARVLMNLDEFINRP
jgi:hypothetical protein